jgi:hypothetical protein
MVRTYSVQVRTEYVTLFTIPDELSICLVYCLLVCGVTWLGNGMGYTDTVTTLLLGSNLVGAWAPGRRCWRLARGFSCGGSASPDSLISCLLTSSTSPSQQRSVLCKLGCEGLGLQVGVSMMSCKVFKQSCQVQVQRFYQRDKRKSWSGLKLSIANGDWDVDLKQWLEYQVYYCKIFKQSCKVWRFNQ